MLGYDYVIFGGYFTQDLDVDGRSVSLSVNILM